MNSKTAKLLRRLAIDTGADIDIIKRMWKDTPQNKRYKVRQEALKQLKKQ